MPPFVIGQIAEDAKVKRLVLSHSYAADFGKGRSDSIRDQEKGPPNAEQVSASFRRSLRGDCKISYWDFAGCPSVPTGINFNWRFLRDFSSTVTTVLKLS
jgi:hypothetical protein